MTPSELVFKAKDDSLVVILPEVVDTLLSYRQLMVSTPESAGVVIGERRGKHCIIRTVSLPSTEDVRTRFSVNRIGVAHQDKVNSAFQESNGLWQYLGEWHTHPEEVPSPSTIDYKSWHKQLHSAEPLILIIVGLTDFWVGKKNNQIIDVLSLL